MYRHGHSAGMCTAVHTSKQDVRSEGVALWAPHCDVPQRATGDCITYAVPPHVQV